MWKVGGFLLTTAQVEQVVMSWGYQRPEFSPFLDLNRISKANKVKSMDAIPVRYPARTPKAEAMILIMTHSVEDDAANWEQFTPFGQREHDSRVRGWLAKKGVTDVPFVTIVDPFDSGY
ncbi:hypothetical protein BOTBODRAFT_25578 [Botryobasidium botryosum FD-172 SS1]|uniref:Uncharacterized protein n=1 Tax=Botryobasidium botryosum (strain FD-172 SS1) TaxID=930990 RepID=A0A067N2F9_BOTB1|nr:hypothetical protein BOTBODRAFT_25578 [Botryobasidium botryosum FD-172 SS1]